MKEIIDIFSGLLVPLTTLIMVYIAYQQMKANRIKVKYNLYADREKIFDATMEFIGLVFTDGVAQRKDINDFLRKTNKSKFLLGKKVSNYLDTLRENARELLRLEFEIDRLTRNVDVLEPEVKKYTDKTAEIFIWFTKQAEEIEKIFKKYLDISKG
jgi:hypothetical protein